MFEVTIPIRTHSRANLRINRFNAARLTKQERGAAMLAVPKHRLIPVVVVELTRFGPRELDDDNLRGALKATRDGVASRLQIDDGSPLVRWEYRQEIAREFAVRVRIARLP